MDELFTPRLLLEPITEAHLEDLHRLNSDPEVMRFLDGVRSREQSRAELLRILAGGATPGFGGWAVRRRTDRAFLGRCGIKRSAETGEPELLYALRAEVWGQGYATEAARAVLRHTFDHGVPLVIACAVPANTASVVVMQRIGMRFARLARMYEEEMVVYSAGA
jgi:ribosomal-protein-alanine N-acetyltransferase